MVVCPIASLNVNHIESPVVNGEIQLLTMAHVWTCSIYLQKWQFYWRKMMVNHQIYSCFPRIFIRILKGPPVEVESTPWHAAAAPPGPCAHYLAPDSSRRWKKSNTEPAFPTNPSARHTASGTVCNPEPPTPLCLHRVLPWQGFAWARASERRGAIASCLPVMHSSILIYAQIYIYIYICVYIII